MLLLVLSALSILSLISAIVGAVFLRVACAWYNKMLGKPVKQPNKNIEIVPNSAVHAQSDNPFAAPNDVGAKSTVLISTLVPEPGFGKAFVICLAAMAISSVISILFGFGLRAAMRSQSSFALACSIFIASGLIVFTLLTKFQLPTTCNKATQVVVLFLVILISVAFLTGLLVVVFVFVLS